MSKITNQHLNDAKQSDLSRYVAGFVLSVIFTILAYLLLVTDALSGWNLVYVLSAMAVIQCGVQLVFFLDLTKGGKPRWRIGVFLFMLLVLFIVVVGSVLIMHSLNGRMMKTPKQMQEFMNSQVGI